MRIRYSDFRQIFQLLSQLCGGGTWLTKAVPTSTAKKPKKVMHFRVWNVTRSGNFFMGVASNQERITMTHVKYLDFWPISQLLANCVAAALGLLKPCRLQRRKNPRRWCTFVSEMSLGRETFLWVWQSALGRSQTGFWTNMIRKFIHQFSGHFLTWALKNISCTMGHIIYILDSSSSSWITFWTSKFSSSCRSSWTVIWNGNLNGSWTDKLSYHFSTAKEMSVKATLSIITCRLQA